MRAIAGFLIAGAIALAARRTRSLDASGALAGLISGTLCVAAGWSWGILLLSLFLSATGLSRIGMDRKAALLGPMVEKDSERDAWQVLANGGVFVVAAVAALVHPSPAWYALGAGAIGASTADTWATEIGALSRGTPLSIVTGRRVATGTSGGVTMIGTLAGVAGALFIAIEATLANWPVPFAAAALGGMAGTLADSVAGATLQSRRWCDVCGTATERRIHTCSTRTRHVGGIRGFDNDVVNVVCSGVGALVALLVSQ